MKIQLLANILKNGSFLPEGTILEVSDDEAQKYMYRNLAELLTDEDESEDVAFEQAPDELDEIIKNAGAKNTRKKS